MVEWYYVEQRPHSHHYFIFDTFVPRRIDTSNETNRFRPEQNTVGLQNGRPYIHP